MKILVTGANGYLGRGIVKELLDRGEIVIATDFRTDGIDPRARIFSENLFAIENPYQHFGKPDILLHLAWRNGFKHDDESHIIDLPKHYLFLKNRCASGIHQVAVMGTRHEIGFFEGSVDENTPCHPVTNYGIAKNSLREFTHCLCKKYGTVFQWLRGFYIVGNTPYGNSIFSKLLQAESEGKEAFPFTSGKNEYDFLDYPVFVDFVCATILQDQINGIINISSGWPVSLGQRVEEFIRDNHLQIKLAYGTYPDRPYDSHAIWGNNKKIAEIRSYSKYGK